ncbi:MAG: hypothetical protein K6A94_03545 [Bacteroidales bacterium]|nr:hypothetical protein [Bacteroidales bacterium]
MTLTEIGHRISKALNIGGNILATYITWFKEAYQGDKRAIDDFKARYNDDGNGVVFTITINVKQKEFSFPIAKSRYNYRKQ